MPAAAPDDRLELDAALDLLEGLRRACRTGQWLDLAGGVPDAELDPAQGGGWLADRWLPAELVRQVLLEADLHPDPRGLSVRGAAVTGVLDLDAAKLPCRLGFRLCHFECPPTLENASIPALALVACHLPGLLLDGVRVDGSVFCNELAATGGVRAIGAHISGSLLLQGATLINPDGNALDLGGAHIDGGAFCAKLTAIGEVEAIGAHIGGRLDLRGAELINPNGTALDLGGARVDGGAFCAKLTATGEVRMNTAHLGAHLDLTGAKFTNPDGKALNLLRLQVAILLFDDAVTVKGVLDLTRAQIGTLVTGGRLPGPLVAAGWRVEDVHGALRTDRKAAARWLASAPRFVAQPWHELAQVYDRNGQPADGRFLRLNAAHRTTKSGQWWSKPPRWGYGLLVGYGYRPLLAGAWLVLAFLCAGLITSTNTARFVPSNRAALQLALSASNAAGAPTRRGQAAPGTPAASQDASKITGATGCSELHGSYPCLRPLLYGLDVVLPPAITTGQSTAWRPSQDWIAYSLTGLKTFGWLLTALLLAGVTGLLRKT